MEEYLLGLGLTKTKNIDGTVSWVNNTETEIVINQFLTAIFK